MRLATKYQSWWWMAGLWLVLFIVVTQPVTSQKIDTNNTMLRWYCSFYKVMNGPIFLRNLNTTFSSLRKQLSTDNNYHAVAKTLFNGESVHGLALCRDYLSTADCLSCFDTAVDQLKVCGIGNGARIFYDNCEIRYENRNFYAESITRTKSGICGNITSSHPKQLDKTARTLFSDLQIAIQKTPKISNFFAASKRLITGGNATVYAIAQCGRNLSQRVCVDCLAIRRRDLDDCLPNTFGRAVDSGCFMRYSEASFFEINQTIDITPFLRNGDSSNLRNIVGGLVGAIGFLFLILAFFIWYRGSNKSNNPGEGNSTGATDMLQRTTVYTYTDLKAATNNFCTDCKIGGESSEVFKGVLKDGKTVAIKKTTMKYNRGKAYLDGELKVISNVHHRYLIRLLGYCIKGCHLYLVHEYIENGSLDKFLFGDKHGTLNWKQRFDIVFGIARAIAYLHEQYHVTIIHRDITSNNILLDNEYMPKITDFGLAKLLPEDKTHLSTKVTTSMSNGYIAPEYIIHGHLSENVDTYSFGIVVLEIISGKWCNEMFQNESVSLNLINNARVLYENGMHSNLIDVTLLTSEYIAEAAKKILEIALMCTQPKASARPTMSKVVALLSEISLPERISVNSAINNNDASIHVERLPTYKVVIASSSHGSSSV